MRKATFFLLQIDNAAKMTPVPILPICLWVIGRTSCSLRDSSAGHGILPIVCARHYIFPAMRRCFHPWCAGALPRLENLRLPGKLLSLHGVRGLSSVNMALEHNTKLHR